MSISTGLIAELKHEGASTRKILERVPQEHFDWQPHAKSMSLKRIATHIAEIPVWIQRSLTGSEMDFLQTTFTPSEINSTADIVALFDKNMNEAIAALEKTSNETFAEKWKLRRGDHVIAELPRAAAVRNLTMNHTVHHRGQLSVYLRLLDVPVPGMYGPSADER